MTNNLRFTVIIPTRERSDTLKSALQSCVSQNYENLEIIVSDNCSQDDTQAVVASFNDRRIKYINPGQRLSMAGNWEFALGHATGDYVNYIGDDDAMLPRAYSTLNGFLSDLKCQAFCWKKDDFVYFWPSTAEANLLSISLWGNRDYQEKDSQEALRNVLAFRASYNVLPLVYSGVIQRQVLDKIAAYGQYFFSSMTPDVYSGIAIATEIDRFYFSGQPYSMAGLSVHSTGASAYSDRQSATSPEAKFYQENDRLPHRQMGANPVNLQTCVADSMLIARDILPKAKDLQIDLVDLMTILAKEAGNLTPEKYATYMNAVRQIGQLNGLGGRAEELIAKFPNRSKASKPSKLIDRANAIGTVAYLNCADFGIDNVYDASVLVDHVLSMQKGGCFSLKYRINKFLSGLLPS
jgi:Glycosyl transferase family 2